MFIIQVPFSRLASSNKSGDTPSSKGSKVNQDSDPGLGSFHAMTSLSPFFIQKFLSRYCFLSPSAYHEIFLKSPNHTTGSLLSLGLQLWNSKTGWQLPAVGWKLHSLWSLWVWIQTQHHVLHYAVLEKQLGPKQINLPVTGRCLIAPGKDKLWKRVKDFKWSFEVSNHLFVCLSML